MSEFPPDILKHVRLHKRLEMVNNCCRDEHGRYLWQSYSASAAGFPKFLHHHCDGTDLPGGSGCYCKQQKMPILLRWNCDPILLLSNFLRQLQSTSAFVCLCGICCNSLSPPLACFHFCHCSAWCSMQGCMWSRVLKPMNGIPLLPSLLNRNWPCPTGSIYPVFGGY